MEKVETHWSKKQESGTVLGIKFLLMAYRSIGRRFIDKILLFISGYYFVFGLRAGRASHDFIRRYRLFIKNSKTPAQPISRFQMIYAFTQMAVDKVAVWCGEITTKDVHQEGLLAVNQIFDEGKGSVFISSHFGNIEVCRALSRMRPEARINALVYTENSIKFNDALEELCPESKLTLVSVKNFGLELAMTLKDKIDRGEWIVIMGDRISAGTVDRTLTVNFLGDTARVSEGPYILAQLLQAPVYSFHCFKNLGKYQIDVRKIYNGTRVKRAERPKVMNAMAQLHFNVLQELVLKAPTQWFNFFMFWKRK